MAEMPMVAPRNLTEAMRNVVSAHTRIRQEIQGHAADVAARRDAEDERKTAEQKLGYRA